MMCEEQQVLRLAYWKKGGAKAAQCVLHCLVGCEVHSSKMSQHHECDGVCGTECVAVFECCNHRQHIGLVQGNAASAHADGSEV